MAYLDVTSMICALRANAEDFEMDRGWLHHFPSHHRFKISKRGGVQLRANCDCARLIVSDRQGLELSEAYQEWRSNYWSAAEINREFASHFKQLGRVGHLWRGVVRRLLWSLYEYDSVSEADATHLRFRQSE